MSDFTITTVRHMEWVMIVGVLVIDQLTKYWIQHATFSGSIEMIHNFFYITYVKNQGAAWGIFSGKTVALSLLAAVASVVMICLLFRHKRQNRKITITTVALSLMIAGAIGNLVDRLLFGYVRDFLNFYIFTYDFPVFNVADISLCCGVGLLILASFLEKEETPQP